LPKSKNQTNPIRKKGAVEVSLNEMSEEILFCQRLISKPKK